MGSRGPARRSFLLVRGRPFALSAWHAAALTLALALPGQRPQPTLSTFDFAGVTLDDGLLRRQLDDARQYYVRIPNDDLLHGFRTRRGLPAPGRGLGGWYGSDVFHVFGQIVSGLARLHAATRDPELAAKVRALVHGFGECVEDDGWFFASRNPNAPHYTFDKVAGGLVDAAIYCGDTEAKVLLARITAWGEKNLARDRKARDTSTEWYTLSENLYRAFALCGDERYREFAAVWHYDEWWQLLCLRNEPFRPPPRHAYSHLNTAGGAAIAYELTGVRAYLDTAVAAHDLFSQQQAFATGGFGPDEQLLPEHDLLRRLSETHHSAETQCGAWAVFKLCKRLLRITGDARYGDWIERQCYNAIAATIPSSPDGRVFYYSDYCSTGASKFLHREQWTCCSGTRPQAVAEVVDLVFLRAGDDLCVNLFVPATAHFTVGGAQVTVVQRTSFPADDRIELEVACQAPVTFGLWVRVPGWLQAGITASLGDAPVRGEVGALNWWRTSREWRPGDRLTLRLPVPLWTAPLLRDQATPAAILAGPVVLAVRSTGAPPHGRIDLARLADVLEPSPGEALTFHVRGAPELLLRPFFAFAEGEPYWVYLDPSLAHRIPHAAVTFTGTWHDAGRFRYGNEKDATAEVTFEGTGVRWLGYAFDDAGIAEATIDGKIVTRIDQFAPGRDLPFDWQHSGLAPGRHTLKLRLTGDRAAGSKDCFLNIAGFDVVPAH
ncbi:MAG TPA: beta-L-arabinofuranosidase domain-containing protein [Planctomycetota bacterium]|nr:beta-L-arabinofuranosidase domain-containing protein [Planctomycetota bacterium]